MHPSLKWKLAAFLPRDAVPILCPSIGRVGSTIVWRALVHARTKTIFRFCKYVDNHLIRESVWELEGKRFRQGAIYKTHDLPHGLTAPASLKIVFLYGRPSDSALSVIRCHETKGAEWVARHFAHMHADGDYDDLPQRDVLRMGEQIEAWRAVRDANILGMRYQTLWDNIDVLRNFVGLRVELPPRKERSFSDMNPATVALVRENYRELDSKVASLPDYFHSQAGAQCRN